MYITKSQLETLETAAIMARNHMDQLDAALDSSTRHNIDLHKATPNVLTHLDSAKTIAVALLTETISDSILLEGTVAAVVESNNHNNQLNPPEQEGVSSSSSQHLVE